MIRMTTRATAVLSLLLVTASCAAVESNSVTSQWRKPNPDNVLHMQLETGVVVIELAPTFAPRNTSNIRTLAKEHYYDGLAIVRSHDNYVVQWGDPSSEKDGRKPIGSAAVSIEPEFHRALDGLTVVPIDSRDAYADKVGFVDGFPTASDAKSAWLTHCYGMVGVGRDMEPDSGNGTSLYVVTGHAPRHLDRNITLVGRVIAGIENLTALPRGTGPLGFYESADEMIPISSVRLESELGEGQTYEILDTTSSAFADFVEGRTNRNEDWFVDPTGRIEICNLHPPVRKTE